MSWCKWKIWKILRVWVLHQFGAWFKHSCFSLSNINWFLWMNRHSMAGWKTLQMTRPCAQLCCKFWFKRGPYPSTLRCTKMAVGIFPFPIGNTSINDECSSRKIGFLWNCYKASWWVFPYNIHHQALLQASRPLQRWIRSIMKQDITIHWSVHILFDLFWVCCSTRYLIWTCRNSENKWSKTLQWYLPCNFPNNKLWLFSLGLPKSHLFQRQNPAARRSWDDTTLLNLHLFSLIFYVLDSIKKPREWHRKITDPIRDPTSVTRKGDESPPGKSETRKRQPSFHGLKCGAQKLPLLEKQRSSTKQCTIVPAQVSTSTCKISGAVAWWKTTLREVFAEGEPPQFTEMQVKILEFWHASWCVAIGTMVQCSIGTEALPWDSLELFLGRSGVKIHQDLLEKCSLDNELWTEKWQWFMASD